MTLARQHSNIAARMGRWSAGHWKTATFGWLALLVVAFAVGGQVGTKNVDPNAAGPGESGRMNRILDAGFKQPAGESVLIQSGSARPATPAFAAAVNDVVGARLEDRRRAARPARPGREGRALGARASSRSAATRTRRATRSRRSSTRVDEAQQAHPGFFIGEFGDASSVEGGRTTRSRATSRAPACSRSRSR